eukprot:2677334-Rhodomonas_salina.2
MCGPDGCRAPAPRSSASSQTCCGTSTSKPASNGGLRDCMRYVMSGTTTLARSAMCTRCAMPSGVSIAYGVVRAHAVRCAVLTLCCDVLRCATPG